MFTENPEEAESASRELSEVLRETAELARVPAVMGIPIGHIDDQLTLPLGAAAELDADSGTLSVVSPSARAFVA